MSGTVFGLWRSFPPSPPSSSLLLAQKYAVGESQRANYAKDPNNFFGGTQRFSSPIMLTTGIWVAQNLDASQGFGGVTDPLALPWPTEGSWVTKTPPASVITSDVYVALFSSDERAAILLAAQTNPLIASDLVMAVQSGVIDLTQEEVTSGVAELVSVGALTQARANVILTIPAIVTSGTMP